MSNPLVSRFLHFVVRDETLPLTIRLFRLVCATAAIVCLPVVLPMNLCLNLPILVHVADVLFGCFAWYCLRASWNGRHYLKLFFFALLGFLGAMWISIGGSQGSITFYYFAAILYPVAIFRGRLRWSLTLLLGINVFVLVGLEYRFPWLVVPFQQPSDRLLDLLTTVMASFVAAAMASWLILDNYDREQVRLSRLARDLAASEQNFREIFNSTSEGIVIYDAETGAMMDVNESLLKNFGFTHKEEVLQGNIGDLSATEPSLAANRAQELIRKTYQEGSQVFEWLAKKRDGARFWTEVSLSRSQFNGKGTVLAVIRDITARKQAEEEKARLEEQNRQLQKTESLGRMAGAVAHHFNNQLQAVMMSLELTRDRQAGDAESVADLSDAMESVGKAAEVSSLMLTYLGHSRGKREALDLSELCLRSMSLLHAVIPRSAVLATDLPTPGPVIHANANEIQQVLTNLITNAWEASGDARGAICLTTKMVPPREIPSSNRFPVDWQPQHTAYGCLKVTDAGGGIAAQDIEKIFEPFYSTKFTGRGMGLAVVLGIVRNHGGAITVESAAGRGSVFRVFLPRSEEGVPCKPLSAGKVPEIAGGGTVLLVEDELIVRKAMTLALQRLGFTVLAAMDGVEALELFGQHQDKIRLVLSDLTMPRMDGWETLMAVRKMAPGFPVVLASGYSEAQVMAGEHAEMPQAFLSKPYVLKTLRDTIARALANDERKV